MSRLRPRLNLVLAVLVVSGLCSSGRAWAQTDSWSFLVTPQVWISHIPQNGFNPANTLPGITSQPGLIRVDSSKHDDGVSPQFGFQAAAQKGRWTLSGAFQYVNFETVNDLQVTQPVVASAPPCIPLNAFQCEPARTGILPAGFSLAKERLNTTRMDADFAVTYFVPDVVKNWLDLSIGGGFKLIYATSSRQFEPKVLTYGYSFFNVPDFQAPAPAFYLVCPKDDGSDCVRKDRVKTKDYFYGATIPMGLITHLSSDGKWLFPFSVTPFLGVENRDDQDVLYALTQDRTKVQRLDGTKFAYGGTVDATLRWLISDTLSAYAGMRVQYIKGHEEFLAYGPLVGMSVRFGGK